MNGTTAAELDAVGQPRDAATAETCAAFEGRDHPAAEARMARRWGFGVVLSLCCVFVAGCSHAARPAAEPRAVVTTRPPTSPTIAVTAPAAQSAATVSWDAASILAAQKQVQAQVAAADPSELAHWALDWTFQPFSVVTPLTEAEAQWAGNI